MKDENFMIMYALIIIGLLIALCGCNSVKYVPIKEIHTDVEHVHDTVKQTDSIWNERTTVIREVDSTELAALGIKINNLQQEKAWIRKRRTSPAARDRDKQVRRNYVRDHER